MRETRSPSPSLLIVSGDGISKAVISIRAKSTKKYEDINENMSTKISVVEDKKK